VRLEAFEIGIVKDLCRRLFDRTIHALGLSVSPRVVARLVSLWTIPFAAQTRSNMFGPIVGRRRFGSSAGSPGTYEV
jgi:hypothetical protein